MSAPRLLEIELRRCDACRAHCWAVALATRAAGTPYTPRDRALWSSWAERGTRVCQDCVEEAAERARDATAATLSVNGKVRWQRTRAEYNDATVSRAFGIVADALSRAGQ